MNLKMKLTQRVTAIARIVNNTTAVFSDEVSPTTDDCLRILEADDRDKLIKLIQSLAAELNKDTRFDTVLLLVNEDNSTTRFVRKRQQEAVSF